MYRAALYIIVATALCDSLAGAERKSWNKIRYVGGTVSVKTSAYDWNTTLTVTANPDSITVLIAPAKLFSPIQAITIKPSQIISLARGPDALHRVAEVDGAQLPSKPPSLFGLLDHPGYMGIIYQLDAAKRGALLLDSYYSSAILSALETLIARAAKDSR